MSDLPTKIGKYEIQSQIGRGNEVVYSAVDPFSTRRVASRSLILIRSRRWVQADFVNSFSTKHAQLECWITRIY